MNDRFLKNFSKGFFEVFTLLNFTKKRDFRDSGYYLEFVESYLNSALEEITHKDERYKKVFQRRQA